MRGSNDRRGRFISFFVGVAFCLLGVFMLIYISKNIIIDAIRESAKTKDAPSTNQPLPPINDSELPLPPKPRPFDENQGDQLPSDEGAIDQTLPSSKPLPPLAPGQLGEVHGQGSRSHLRSVPSQYTNKNESVHQNVYPALMTLISAAKQDGIDLSIVSAYRSYDHQRRIWENKWGAASNTDTEKAKNILRYSSFPGTSRHHWGTDIDFNSVALDYWSSAKGRTTHRWLANNAPKFGFCQVYAPGRNKGYSDEPWHWSHMPTASYYYGQLASPQVLQTALSQPLKGAAAVRTMPEYMMGYITGVSGCRVSAQPARAMRSTVSTQPQKANPKRSAQEHPVSESQEVSYEEDWSKAVYSEKIDDNLNVMTNKKPTYSTNPKVSPSANNLNVKSAQTDDYAKDKSHQVGVSGNGRYAVAQGEALPPSK